MGRVTPIIASIVEHNLARTAYGLTQAHCLVVTPALLYGDDQFVVFDKDFAVVQSFTRQELIDRYAAKATN